MLRSARLGGLVVLLTLTSACGGGGGGGSAAPAGSGGGTGSGGGSQTQGCSVTVTDTTTKSWPTNGWQTAAPQTQGLCPDDIQAAMAYAFAAGNDTGAVLVIKNGRVVAERYTANKTADDLVTSWSVAKSVTSALVGAAIDEGAIKGLDQRVGEFISAWSGTAKGEITVHHLLTVRTALELIGDADGDGVPDGAALYNASDQLALSLQRPLIGTPGEKLYTYSNSDVMLAGELVRAATGVPIDEYLRVGLGQKIGFNGEWWRDSTDHVMSYCCIDATPLNFARFGLLFARQGEWNGEKVLSQAWFDESTIPARGGTYGFYWWPLANKGFAALGLHAQVVAVYPNDDLVVLRFSNYARIGDGRAVKDVGNYHQTSEPAAFDTQTFLNLVRGALINPAVDPGDAEVPEVDAGLDQTAIKGSQVTLFGGRSTDGDSDPLAFDWELVDAPVGSTAVITGIGSTVNFVADVAGNYVIELRVSDGINASSVDQLVVQVVEQRDILTTGTAQGMWPVYAGNLSSNKYSPLDQIDRTNVGDLSVVWRWRSPDNDLAAFQNSAFEATPLMIDGVLYTSTSFSQVAAINAATGETLWVYDPQSYNFGRPPNNGFLHRGVSYDESTGRKIIYMPTGDARLIALDAVSGKPIADFGSLGRGVVDLLDGIPRLNESTTRLDDVHDQPDIPDLAGVVTQVGNTSPAVICRNVLILGSSVHDGEVLPPSPPGDVRGFDLATGELLWSFHTVPREGEFGADTWGNESFRTNGNTNVWAPMSADEALGQVYLPVSCPTNNYYGGRRHGDNLFANSIVALDCETGERNWHFQTIHHDIWDYDLPAAPNLVDITVAGEPVRALAQVSKQGFVYVLDRVTGEPVWPIVETPVPPSTVPGELAALTQPIPSKPPPFVRQGSVRADLINPASADAYDVGPLYTPPTLRGLIVTPGEGGGANWGGASYDPLTQRLYVSGFGPLTHKVALQPGNEPNFYYVFPDLFFGPNTGSPYPGLGSAVTAYDLNEGTIVWQVAGDADSTVIGNSASVVAGDLLFYKTSSLTTLNVIDKNTGQLLRRVPLGGRPTGAPMTYQQDGRQFVVVALGRQNELMEIVALALPGS
ncbi:MAG: serine hydrolase [Proteobacteria bacterium]|nr:serine hydrolase [Pseudomonadota bacterium]